jgi:hypothetical protein
MLLALHVALQVPDSVVALLCDGRQASDVIM